MKTTIKTLCGLLAILAFTACSSNTDEAVNAPQFWHVTLTASMGDETTRALSADGNTITASFAENDEVKVLKSDGTLVGTLTVKTAGASTTLDGIISGTFSVNEELTCRYRSETANYDGQNGTLAGIATGQDYAEGKLIVSATDPLAFKSSHVSLAAKQSITKFSFTCGGSPVSVKTFGIAATGLVQSIAADATSTETVGAVTGELDTALPNVYIALRNNSGIKQKYYFTIKDNAGNWYTGTKSAPLENGKNYTASVALTKLDALTSSSAVGTIGVVGGLPAIVVEFNSTKKAVALMNAGALCPEDYGEYYTYENRASGLSNGWYVPTQDELFVGANNNATGGLAYISNAWTTQNGVKGRLFTISEGKTLFFPAAGYYENGNNLLAVSTDGYYWSSTEYDTNLAYYLDVDNSGAATYSEYQVDRLSVRPFHAL